MTLKLKYWTVKSLFKLMTMIRAFKMINKINSVGRNLNTSFVRILVFYYTNFKTALKII